MLSEVAAATAAGGAGLALMAGSKLANMQTRAPIEEARSAQEIFTRRALPVSLAAGVALIIAGYTVAPRDYSGLSIEGRFLVGTGIMALVVLPLVHAWRTASSLALFGAAASLLAGTFLLTQYADAGKTRDMLVVAGGILGFWSAIEGWRYFRVGGRGLLRATRFVFTWPFTSASVVQATARRLSGENLVAAYHLPEHTALARQVVNRELTARGEPPQVRNDDWLPEPHRATLGPAVARSIPADRYTRYVRNRLRLVGVVRVLGVVGVVTVVGLVVIAPLLSLIVSIGGFLGRKRAGRVLLLRPFNQARMTAALKTVVRTHIGPLGHVVTLSDRNYRPNFALAALTRIFDILTLVVGPLLRPSFRIASVKDERSFFKFAAFLSKKWRPSSFGLLCSDQAFNVRTTDHWWKRCIDLLLRSSDVIVMDISRVSAGSAWEITQLSERGLLQSCIFICQKDYLDEARATFSTLVSGGFQPDIQAFTAEGVFVDNAAELKAQLVSRMASAAATWGALRAP